jgi:prepilin-type N-terminal cleavage/methylation domain-containing protein
MKKTLCFGFTLVELLVVIAIIGALIALLLPAVQAAREAARRTQCANKVKQLSLATHNFHDTNTRLPCMGADPILSNKRLNRGSFLVVLLPFLEQQALYDSVMALAPASGTVAIFSNSVLSVKLDAFLCPSDGNWGLWKAGETTPCNYRGSRADLATVCSGISTAADYRIPRSWLRNGLMWADETAVKGGSLGGLEMIADGTSNSVMYSEGIVYDRDTSTNGGNYKARLVVNGIGWFGQIPQTCLNAKAGMINGTQTSYYHSEIWHNVGMRAFDWYAFHCAFYTLLPPNSPSCTDAANTGWADNAMMSASSNHPGGVQISMLDASGRFISDSIQTKNLNLASTTKDYPNDATNGQFSYGVWSELGSINGGENPSIE